MLIAAYNRRLLKQTYNHINGMLKAETSTILCVFVCFFAHMFNVINGTARIFVTLTANVVSIFQSKFEANLGKKSDCFNLPHLLINPTFPLSALWSPSRDIPDVTCFPPICRTTFLSVFQGGTMALSCAKRRLSCKEPPSVHPSTL